MEASLTSKMSLKGHRMSYIVYKIVVAESEARFTLTLTSTLTSTSNASLKVNRTFSLTFYQKRVSLN